MALIERKVVLTEKDSSGNTVMNFPVTRAEYVEDAVLSVNGAKGAVTIGTASQSAQGLMSASDKAKLDGIATGANKYSLPTATASTKGGVTIGDNITVSSGKISLTKANVTTALGYEPPTSNTTYSPATQSAQGLMSAADKKKLDGIAEGANNYTYTLPTASSSTKGGVTIGDNITVSSGKISLTKSNVTSALGYTPLQTAPVTSVNSKTGAVSLAASDVGALSTGGGTLSGGIAYSVDEIVSRTVDTGAAKFFGGSTSNDGASLILSGKSRPTFPGQFNLNACDGTTTTSLLGKADGTLTWGSKNVVRSVNGTAADASGNVTVSVDTANKATATPNVVLARGTSTKLPSGGTWKYVTASMADGNWKSGSVAGGTTISVDYSSNTAIIAIRIA